MKLMSFSVQRNDCLMLATPDLSVYEVVVWMMRHYHSVGLQWAQDITLAEYRDWQARGNTTLTKATYHT